MIRPFPLAVVRELEVRRDCPGGVVNVELDDVASMLSSGPFGSAGESPMFRSAIAPVCMLLTDANVRDNMCMGKIGSKGEKACTREKINGEACGTAAHAQKASIREDAIYFWDPNRNHIYLRTHLGFSVPMAAELFEMRHEEFTHVQVRELMDVIRTGQVASEEELVQAKDRITRSGDDISFTPRKKPRFSSSASSESPYEIDAMDTIEEMPEDPLVDDSRKLEYVMSNWKKMTDTIEALKLSAKRGQRGEDEIARLGEDVDRLNAAGRRLMSLVGLPADGLKYDLYKITEGQEESLRELEDSVDKVRRSCPPQDEWAELKRSIEQAEVFKRQVEGWKLEVDAAIRAAKDHGGSGEATVNGTRVSIQKLAEVVVLRVWPAIQDMWALYELATVGPDGGKLKAGSGVGPPGAAMFDKAGAALAEQASGMVELEARISRLEKGAPAAAANRSGGGDVMEDIFGVASQGETGAGGSFHGRAGAGDLFGGGGSNGGGMGAAAAGYGAAAGLGWSGQGGRAPSATEEVLEGIMAKLADVESRMGAVTVECAGFKFRNQEDCVEFVTLHVPGHTYAYFYDMVSLLQRAWGDTHVAVGKHWEDIYARKKAGFTNLGEAAIAASMATVLPTCLGEDPAKLAAPTAALSAIPTHAHWTSAGGQAGRKLKVNRTLHKTNHTLRQQVKDQFVGRPRGGGVVNELLMKARGHWVQFEQMLDNFYMEFRSFGPDKEAWVLVGLIGKTVFEVLNEVRGTAADLTDCATPVQRAARVLWATLQASRIMDEFIAAEFRNHPRVASVIVLHLFKNRVPKDEFDQLRTDHDTMRVQLDSLISQVNSKLLGGNLKIPAKK